jgi:chemotaxis protein histidine kinase CheA
MKDLETQLQDLSERLSQEETRRITVRQLHTIKGNARTLGLLELAEAVHQVESAHQGEGSMPDLCARLIALAAQYTKLYQSMFQGAQETATTLLSMVDGIQAGILEQLDANRTDFGAMVVKDEVGHWPKAWQEPMRVLLLHALTNAVDHGYILPQYRAAVHLEVEAMRSPKGVRLCIRDRGQGIPWETLQKLASERQYQPPPGRPLTDLLFDDGVSTSRSISLSSGRGVGLAAVKDACRELGAVVTLADNDEGQGTMLVVEIPEEAQALSA